MDTPATESSALDTNQAAALFANILEPQAEPENKKPEDTAKPAEPEKVEQDKPEEVAEPSEEGADADETITIQVDGKDVEIKKSELPELYKGQLRQADYTKKTMETAEQRKAAEAEISKARDERNRYMQGLSQAQALVQAQLHEQSQIDWQTLLETDPKEYLRQQHLAQARQAKLGQINQAQQQLYARQQQEAAQQMHAFVQTQQQELLAKLPEWKDESKAKADREAIKSYLKDMGLDDAQIGNITDHRVVLISRKAMLYDQMMEKAQATAKKVSQLPQKVERPGGGSSQALDGRSAAMKQLQKSGKVEDAARVFASIL